MASHQGRDVLLSAPQRPQSTSLAFELDGDKAARTGYTRPYAVHIVPTEPPSAGVGRPGHENDDFKSATFVRNAGAINAVEPSRAYLRADDGGLSYTPDAVTSPPRGRPEVFDPLSRPTERSPTPWPDHDQSRSNRSR
jgi:hypothetical protein